MKRITLLLIAFISLPFFSYSGGIVHNTNQSALWVGMPARDASLDIDAVFYNPAGLTKLGDGFFISLNNQYLTQKRFITSDYKYLYDAPKTEFEGSVNAPLFPGIYAAYNVGKFSLSLGINPVGGGGSASYESGLPSFEMMLSDLVPVLQGYMAQADQAVIDLGGADPGFRNITGYDADILFEGSSVFWGYQFNAAYEINDMFSVALGARYISAKNTYTGHLKDVAIDAPATYGGTQAPGDYLRTVALTPGLDALTVATLNGTAAALDAQTGDFEVDVEQTATAFTPIISLNVTPSDKMNIALKYELPTKLELENKTKVDGSGLFPDKEKNRMDLPGFLSAGLNYKITDKFLVSGGFHYYFDKGADYGHKDATGEAIKNEDIFDSNFMEFAIGLQYGITESIDITAGYLRAQTGANEKYHSDLTHSLSSNTFGIGSSYAVSPMIDINLGVAFTTYAETEKEFNVASMTGENLTVVETYDRSNFFVGLGLDFKFGKN